MSFQIRAFSSTLNGQGQRRQVGEDSDFMADFAKMADTTWRDNSDGIPEVLKKI
jgi:hypothetical protein